MVRSFRVSLLCLGILLLAEFAGAQDYNSVLHQVLETGKVNGPFNYLEFQSERRRQYAVAKKLDSPDVVQLTFIEELWNGTGDNDVIDQWVVEVSPHLAAFHYEIIEHGSLVLSVRELSTEGAEHIVQRISEKTLGMETGER